MNAQQSSRRLGRSSARAGKLRSGEFGRTIKSGARVGSRDLTIHFLEVGSDWPDETGVRKDVALTGGPWFGLIVSKAVGNSVVRHSVARRLRAAFAYLADTVDLGETYVVIRARPSVVERSSVELGEQLVRAFAKAGVVGADSPVSDSLTSGAVRP
ncbi:ribonuclease P protein component [Gordonia sp. TBRC 11910]|uniref:Ribonuclease P protein component n=1 Tax=Gordonia asplenii TaxID=2725283 RepID=A0A848KVL0_9ACTN|nr:ribonuclease P protein component [Gordonia asplenii]NMO02590.1 ribonuclease P protein component [Gordonia asplenii]